LHELGVRKSYEELDPVCSVIGNHIRTDLVGVLESMLADGGFEFGVPLLLARPERFAIKIGHFVGFLDIGYFLVKNSFPVIYESLNDRLA